MEPVAFTNTATRKISSDEIETYNRDGVVCLRGFFDEGWIDRLRGAIDRAVGSNGAGRSQNIDGFALGADLHLTDEEAHAFIFDSGVGRAAADLLRATQIRLFKDHYFVKNAGAPTPTPWHHDLPYWCIDGDQIASFWIPLDVVDANNGAVQYVRGSHRWNRLFNPTSFSESLDARKQGVYEEIPDIDAMRNELDIVMIRGAAGRLRGLSCQNHPRSNGEQRQPAAGGVLRTLGGRRRRLLPATDRLTAVPRLRFVFRPSTRKRCVPGRVSRRQVTD